MKLHTALDTNVSAAAVWQVFGEEFEHISDWSPDIESSALDRPLAVGAIRTNQLAGWGSIKSITQELTHFDRDSKALTYAVRSGLPGFIQEMEVAWTIVALDAHRSRIAADTVVVFAWWALPLSPLVKFGFGRRLTGFIQQLASHMGTLPKD